jgi:hypothetical protein
MAFQNDNFNLGSTIFDSLINLFFLVDMVIQFNSAFYDPDFNIIDDRKVNLIVITISIIGYSNGLYCRMVLY